MKKLLVIINTTHDVSLLDVQKHATGKEELPTGVQRILDTAFLIDTHTSLPIFLSLVNSANYYQLPVAVLDVDDEALLCTELFPPSNKNQ